MKESSETPQGGRKSGPRKRITSASSPTDKRDRRPSAAGSYTGSGRPPFWNKPNDPEFVKKSTGKDGDRKFGKPAGDKRTFSADGARPGKPQSGYSNSRPERGSRPDRPPRTGDRNFSTDGNRPFKPREKSAGDTARPFSGTRPESKSRDGDRPFNKERRFGDKPAGKFSGGKSFGDKPAGAPKFENRDGQRPERRPFGDKKPFESKPYGTRNAGAAPARGFSKGAPRDGERKPEGDKKPFGAPRTGRLNDKEKQAFEKSPRLGKQAPLQAKNFRRDNGPGQGQTPDYNLKRPSRFGAGSRKEKSEDKEGSMMRLNRYIAHSGLCSRREADELISTGQITVNGKMVDQMGYLVKLDDVVKYGKRLLNKEKLVYVLLNKPKDFITTTEDPEERKTVMSLVATACKERIYPVGRLDRQTTGLLLLTNDGELSEKLMHPSHNIRKIYQVDLDKPLTANHEKQIREGIELEDGPAPVDELEVLSKERDIVGISIHLGRNRIVRRIFESLGYEVVKLDRVMYAGLTKKDIPRGNWRFLSEKEVINLKYFS